jgi:hypothetical protein
MEWMFQVHVMLVLVWDFDGITWGCEELLYILNIQIGVRIFVEEYLEILIVTV